MDHLPAVSEDNPRRNALVPYLGGEAPQYPAKPQGAQMFADFPLRHGICVESLEESVAENMDGLSFLQSWLFFGLLRETFARDAFDFHREDFIRTLATGEQVLTTEALPRYLWYWASTKQVEANDDIVELEMTIDSCLQVSNTVLTSICTRMRRSRRTRPAGECWSREGAALLSLSLLGDYLWCMEVGPRVTDIASAISRGGQAVVMMDTLCIPVGQAYTEHRKKAIERIAMTFERADKVLVIDESLRQCHEGMSNVEMLMRIQYSPWMTRLWTYLEGRIATNLYFQIGDRPIHGDELYVWMIQKNNLIKLSQALQNLSPERLKASESAIHLARAICTATPSFDMIRLANEPLQQDPNMEQLRLDAIEQLKVDEEYYSLREVWRPILSEIGRFYELNDDDEAVRTTLEVCVVCPVTKHAFEFTFSVRGGDYEVKEKYDWLETPGRHENDPAA
ncbi:hypothetical protein PG993_011553 [Apiospora rasikravindrae]|uniref:Heterokaryon incompatibility domain-containing protein n=1 Tax=Apiospora rasikravindrae TaxID=990691 RepID=A0ABR1SEJ1_9PEZI